MHGEIFYAHTDAHSCNFLVGVNLMRNREKMSLNRDELEFYSRQIMLNDLGYDGQLRLKQAKVCVVGLGGLGSSIALQLAAMGVGCIRLVDRDVVEMSNLHRQLLYDSTVLGYAKAEVAAKRLVALNPNIALEPSTVSISSLNAEELVDDMDVVIDGLDAMKPRYAINRACVKKEVPYIFGAAIVTYGNASTILPRKTPCLECFQGNLDDNILPNCATVGVHPSILNIIASVEVSEAIRIILGYEPHLANQILHCDIGDMVFEKLAISRATNCPVCGSQPSSPPMSLEHRLVNEICGREGKRSFIITPRENFNLNMGQWLKFLSELDFKVRVNGNLGVTFNERTNKTVSLLKSGVMIIQGAESEKEAHTFYEKLFQNIRGSTGLNKA